MEGGSQLIYRLIYPIGGQGRGHFAGGSHVPGPSTARHEYHCTCGVPCAAAHGAQSKAGRGDASGGRKGSGGSHSWSCNDSGRDGGRVAPLLSGAGEVAPAVLGQDRFTSAARPGPPPPAASPCAGVILLRPRSGAVPPHSQTRNESVGMGGGRPVSLSRTCRARRRL